MLRAKLSCVPAWMLFSLVAFLHGCSTTTPDNTAGWSPNKIYAEAKDEIDSGSYSKAIPLLEKLEGRAAGTLLAQQAQLDKAYAYYKNNEKAQAITTLERFIKLHPASPALDYALYLKGIVNFNENLGFLSSITQQDLSERDQKAAKESFESFSDLVNRFPDSKYTPDARQRMTYILNALAEYEVHVARYYYSRGAYVAAINRAQLALSEYRNVPAAEDALGVLLNSYNALGMDQLRDDARRVLETNYPQSVYLTKGFKTRAQPWWKLW
ncbi:MAG: outer membrane protein assembly factor BamD [Burkholderiaceae bacterium]